MTLAAFEELDYSMTPLGELILRRREVLSLDRAEVFEVKLDGQFLMSSLVNDAEIALAEFALPLVACDKCDVLVGGLGLGYTAKAALDMDTVSSVTVIEYLQRVISWHQRDLVPLGQLLTQDTRCQLIHADFFAVVGSPPAPKNDQPTAPPLTPLDNTTSKQFHAILLDIDHSPQCLLRERHAAFYTSSGLKQLADHILPGGVFALWSADAPEKSLIDNLQDVFASVQVRESEFFNPLLNEQDINYIIIAQREPIR